MGLDHLREFLIRLTRLLLRHGASLAYSGNWQDSEDNFTYMLLRLISAEQEDNSRGGPDTSLQIGKLYNHSSWPYYLEITPNIEAQWINYCRIVRITQQQAGLAEADVVLDADAHNKQPKTIFNAAVTMSAMRRLQMQEMAIPIPGIVPPVLERIPPVVARILLGGKIDRYSGFMPGIFEEALVTMQHPRRRPLYILGGFGGAAEILAQAILTPGNKRPRELTLAWHKKQNPALAHLLASSKQFSLPPGCSSTKQLFDALFAVVLQARTNPSNILHTGLSDAETRELLMTRNIAQAVNLVRKGLISQNKLPNLPA